MSQTYHDQMAKQLFQKFLGAFGEVELSREVPGEARFIDIYFSPYTDSEADPTPLGLLGRLAEHPCLIEPYRNPPSPADMESCLLKLMWILAEQRREAKREPKPLPKLLF